MKDLRTLCDEAIQLWDAGCEMADVIDEMRAILAQPEPEEFTDADLQAQIHALRADYLRMANAVVKQLPDRDKFFADLIPDPS